jgi:hypothetical protein
VYSRSERISLHLSDLSSVALLEFRGDTIDGHSPTTFFVYLFLLDPSGICIWPDEVYIEAFVPQMCILGDWDVLGGEALLMLVEACHLEIYNMILSIYHSLMHYSYLFLYLRILPTFHLGGLRLREPRFDRQIRSYGIECRGKQTDHHPLFPADESD